MPNPKARILIIDYEPRSIEQLRGPLESAGFQIEVAKDGLIGIETFERWQPDLTLIEAMLPKRHGFEVCQELKQTPHGTKTPIVIVTSVYKGRKYRTQAIHNYGCDEYLEKPIDDDTLVSTVRQLLDGRTLAVDVEEDYTEANAPVGSGEPEEAAGEIEDPAEREIMSRLDSILPGMGPSPRPAAPLSDVVLVGGENGDSERSRPRLAKAGAPPIVKANPAPAAPKPSAPRTSQTMRRSAVGNLQRSEPAPRAPASAPTPHRQPAETAQPAVSHGFLKWMGFTVLGLVIAILVLIVVVS